MIISHYKIVCDKCGKELIDLPYKPIRQDLIEIGINTKGRKGTAFDIYCDNCWNKLNNKIYQEPI